MKRDFVLQSKMILVIWTLFAHCPDRETTNYLKLFSLQKQCDDNLVQDARNELKYICRQSKTWKTVYKMKQVLTDFERDCETKLPNPPPSPSPPPYWLNNCTRTYCDRGRCTENWSRTALLCTGPIEMSLGCVCYAGYH